jgi:hypothetical protein
MFALKGKATVQCVGSLGHSSRFTPNLKIKYKKPPELGASYIRVLQAKWLLFLMSGL